MAADDASLPGDVWCTGEPRYRAATLDDVPVLARLNRELIAAEGHRNPMTLTELEERMRCWLAGQYGAALFEHEGVVVAYALYRADGPGIHVRHLYVARDVRRHGIGTHVLRYLARHVWPPDARVTLDVLVGNTGAQAFYGRLGFYPYTLTLEIGGEALATGGPVARPSETTFP
jgi:GNAT superfamily N-acetyltransferase